MRADKLLPVQVSSAARALLSALGSVVVPVTVVHGRTEAVPPLDHPRLLRDDLRLQMFGSVEDCDWARPFPNHFVGGTRAPEMARPSWHRLLEHWGSHVRVPVPLLLANHSGRRVRLDLARDLRRYHCLAEQNVHLLPAAVHRLGPRAAVVTPRRCGDGGGPPEDGPPAAGGNCGPRSWARRCLGRGCGLTHTHRDQPVLQREGCRETYRPAYSMLLACAPPPSQEIVHMNGTLARHTVAVRGMLQDFAMIR